MRSLRRRLPAACAVLLLVAASPVVPRSLSRARPEERDHLGAIPYEPGVGFGLGFSVVKDPGLRGKPGSRDEFGWGGAYHSVYWVDPREQLVVVYFTQLIPARGLDDHDRLRALVYQAIVDGGFRKP